MGELAAVIIFLAAILVPEIGVKLIAIIVLLFIILLLFAFLNSKND